jgi:hypothetical protein
LRRYEVALIYLKQSDYDLDEAVEAYKEDERWEQEHPLNAKSNGKGKGKAPQSVGRRRLGFGGGFSGQLS